MRIAITGVSSTGKTTLSKNLAEYLHLTWISEGCNSAFELLEKEAVFGTKPRLSTHDFSHMTAEDHFRFEEALQIARRDKEDRCGAFVADGEPLLWMSYALIKCPLKISSEELSYRYEQLIFPHLDQFDYVWYCPFGKFPIQSDGYRIDDKWFLYAQDAILKQLIADYTKPFNHKCKVLTLQAVHLEYRLQEIKEVLRNDKA